MDDGHGSSTESLIRFRCSCGRTVVTDTGSDADAERRCSRCRRRRVVRELEALSR